MRISRLTFAALALGTILGAPAMAHRQWLLPSATTLDEEGAYVTFDAAVSEGLFDFDHLPIKIDGLVVTTPDEQAVQPENISNGKRRSTFDLKLPKAGTYRVALVSASVMANYTAGGEQKRFRGTEAEFATAIPKDANDVRVSRMEGRIESFVTVGEPTAAALAPVGTGLEIVPLTNPTENVVGTPARFRALVDGKPAPDIDITIVPGGGRFRANVGDTSVKTDAKGEATVNWTGAGMVWLGASWPPRPAGAPEGAGGPGGPGAGGPGGEGRPRAEGPGGPGAAGASVGGPGAGGPGGPGGGRAMVPRRLSYTATYEVAPF
ncbi:hypothetical protein BH10PSE13_BH10PSE13_12430 [soil metagenome]